MMNVALKQLENACGELNRWSLKNVLMVVTQFTKEIRLIMRSVQFVYSKVVIQAKV